MHARKQASTYEIVSKTWIQRCICIMYHVCSYIVWAFHLLASRYGVCSYCVYPIRCHVCLLLWCVRTYVCTCVSVGCTCMCVRKMNANQQTKLIRRLVSIWNQYIGIFDLRCTSNTCLQMRSHIQLPGWIYRMNGTIKCKLHDFPFLSLLPIWIYQTVKI